MLIDFRTKKLRKQYEDHREAEKAYGKVVARKYIQRVEILKAARDIQELQSIRPLRLHPLQADRAGTWAIDLTGFYRLIVTFYGDALKIVRIEEVSKHYDD